jgi:hypothetical protein
VAASTLLTPTIASFANAAHTHANAAGGGTLTGAVLGGTITGTFDIYNVDWTDYSASSTIAGWSSFTKKKIYYRKLGKLVFVSYYIAGTSNSTGASFTVPYTSSAGTDFETIFAGYGSDATAETITYGYLVSNSSAVSLFPSPSDLVWSSTGTKIIQGQFWYASAT